MARLIVAVVVVGFTVYCLIDAARSDAERVRGLSRPLWMVLILLLPVAGGVAWLLAGRPRSGGSRGSGGTPRHAGPSPSTPPVVRGPDDDPDFLRGLDRKMQDDAKGRDGDVEGDGKPDTGPATDEEDSGDRRGPPPSEGGNGTDRR